jgi:Raf kinase inhibitor-like YbhB/YbcL family protein
MSTRRLAVVAVALVATGLLTSCRSDGRTLRPPRPDQTQSILPATTTTVAAGTSSAPTGATSDSTPASDVFALTAPWADGAAIDPAFTCKGSNQPPPLVWTNVPSGTEELAVAMVDLDANRFIHWLVAGIPADAGGLDPTNLPASAVQATNDHGTVGYYGPCPTAGSGTHHYQLTVYTFAAPPGIVAGMNGKQALENLETNKQASTSVVGTFSA